MADIGIICEMNPMHKGHEYLLREARAQGAERIVCAMSGNTVQRGSFAVADKYARAEALVRSGADLVIELPFPWCSGSAEEFALGGVFVIKDFCDTLLFGSECGNIERLKNAASVADSTEFRRKYKDALADGSQAARAYYDLLLKSGAGELSSNDLLGVEYMRAAKKVGANISFATVKRQGAAYDKETVSDGEYPSALAIREMWKKGEFESTKKYLPDGTLEVIQRVRAAGQLTDMSCAEAAILAFFRLCEPRDMEGIAGAEGGIVNRFCEAAKASADLDEMFERVRTKRYTDAHLRRVMLYCMTGVRKKDLRAMPLYTTLLGATDAGRELLSAARKKGSLEVVTKPADANARARQTVLGAKADALFTLATEPKRPASAMIKARPYIQMSPKINDEAQDAQDE